MSESKEQSELTVEEHIKSLYTRTDQILEVLQLVDVLTTRIIDRIEHLESKDVS